MPSARPLRFEPLEERRLLATITVNTLVDENNGVGSGGVSLREAIAAAQPNDTVDFSVVGTINLTSTGGGHLTINKSLTIQGPGAALLTIKAFDPDGNGNNDGDGRRVFYVDNNSGSLANVTISGLALTNGDPFVDSEEGSVGGGAIHNEENLSIAGCEISGNFGPAGGGILNVNGSLVITNSVITGNAGQDGGGILIEGGSLTLTRTTVSNNQATNAGGGILDRNRPMTIVESTISGNEADEAGGGVYLSSGSLTVTASTISGNVADADNNEVGSGGGIYNSGGELTIASSTISGNSAGVHGGGIYSNTGQTIAISHSTIAANSIPGGSGHNGGGIHSGETASLDHTIVAGNIKGTSTREDVFGSFDALYSLIGDRRSASVSNQGGSFIGTTGTPIDALLDLLAENGAPTRTHALLPGSPAIDAGDMDAVAGVDGVPMFDQRGTPFDRVLDGDGAGGARIDIGAFERPLPEPALLGDYTLDGVVDAADYTVWRDTLDSNVAQFSGADGNGNSVVDELDYGVWKNNFGNALPPGIGSGAGSELSTLMVAAAISERPLPLFAAATLGAVRRTDPRPVVGLRPTSAASDSDDALLLWLIATGDNVDRAVRNEGTGTTAALRAATIPPASRSALSSRRLVMDSSD